MFCDDKTTLFVMVTAGFLYRAGAEVTQTLEKVSKFLSDFSQQWMPKPQFWYPPLSFGSQHRIRNPRFLPVFFLYTAGFLFSAQA